MNLGHLFDLSPEKFDLRFFFCFFCFFFLFFLFLRRFGDHKPEVTVLVSSYERAKNCYSVFSWPHNH